MKILEQFFLITGICANISIMYIHYKFYKMACRNDGYERLNLKDNNFNIRYVDNTKNKDIDKEVDAMDVLDRVVDKLRSDEKEEMDDTTQTTTDIEEEDRTTQTSEDKEEGGHLMQEGDIEERLRRASDVGEGGMEGERVGWGKYLSFGVK